MNNPQIMEQNTVVLLIGKTGSGKSATGNIIFNESVFQSERSFTSVTRDCQTHTGAVNNRRLTVIDTPDFMNSTHTHFDSDAELKRAVELCSPGAHVCENRNSRYTLEMMEETERCRKERERRAEEEKRRQEETEMDRFRGEIEMCLRRDTESEIMEEREKAEKGVKNLLFKQIKLKYICVMVCFAVVTGGILMWKEGSLDRSVFIKGFLTGGSAAAAGVLTGIVCRLMCRSPVICSSFSERPSTVRLLLQKTASIACAASAGALIGHLAGGHGHTFTTLAALAGAAGGFTAI